MAEELRIALVQASLLWENPEANRNNFAKKIAAIPSEIDVIVLPEMFTTGFTMTPEHIEVEEGVKTVRWMQNIAAEKNAALIGSIVFNEKGMYYNRLWFVEPDGRLHSYDKRHTFTLAGEDKVYNSGVTGILVNYKGFRFYPLICYDLRFPIWARNTSDYDVLLYVANWPAPRILAWDTLLKARAIENMAYCIGVNRIGVDEIGHEYPGHSAIYDCLGGKTTYSEKEEIVYAGISKKHIRETREKLRFLEDRDDFTLLK